MERETGNGEWKEKTKNGNRLVPTISIMLLEISSSVNDSLSLLSGFHWSRFLWLDIG